MHLKLNPHANADYFHSTQKYKVHVLLHYMFNFNKINVETKYIHNFVNPRKKKRQILSKTRLLFTTNFIPISIV